MTDFLMALMAESEKVVHWMIVGLAALLARYVYARIASERLRGIAQRANAESFDAGLEVYQTYVQAIKEGRADGKLTEEEKAIAKAKAIAIAKTNLGPKGLRRLARVIGVDVDQWLGTKVEATVATLKAGATAPLT